MKQLSEIEWIDNGDYIHATYYYNSIKCNVLQLYAIVNISLDVGHGKSYIKKSILYDSTEMENQAILKYSFRN